MTIKSQRFKIAVSQCLTGENVRYDGSSKFSYDVSNLISDNRFNIVPFCPEVGIGMGVPRLPIQLDFVNKAIRARRVNNPAEDFTVALKIYAKNFLNEHEDLLAVINKKGSPSCGYLSTKLYESNQLIKTNATGIFLAEIKKLKQELYIIDEEELENEEKREYFLESIIKKAL